MIEFDSFLSRPEFGCWEQHFRDRITLRADPRRHGDLPAWLAIVDGLPEVDTSTLIFDHYSVVVGDGQEVSLETRQRIRAGLFALKPWRKGPFLIFDTSIDTEWRSDWKWQRLAPHISDLRGRRVLDVGCGNGYHCWRMLGAGADYVLGIDPSMRFLVQHLAIQKYARSDCFDLLPLGIEDMPRDMPKFDTVFSMGVLYHRRNPINHLRELQDLLTAGGELLLETLIVDQAKDGTLRPSDRYAMMRNVWSVMTVDKICALLDEAGFEQIRCVDQNITSLQEQRSTEWMQFHSLANFLDPQDQSKTIEGYPAPKRGIFVAKKKR